VFRRKQLPEDLGRSLDGFREVVAEVEAAKHALTGVVPATRRPGTPPAQGIHELEQRLTHAIELMPVWKHPDLEAEWLACDAGIRESLDRARRLREDPRSSAASKD
jgi:hypothetical protein